MATWGPTVVAGDSYNCQEDSTDGTVSVTGQDADGLMIANYSSGSYWNGFIFTTTVPQGSTINSATLRLRHTWDSGGTPDIRVQCEDVDTPANFDAGDSLNLSSRTPTTAYVDDYWTTGDTVFTVSVTSPVQEVVNRGSFSGKICFICEDLETGSGYGQVDSYSTGDTDGDRPALTIDYTESGAGDPGLSAQSVTIRPL